MAWLQLHFQIPGNRLDGVEPLLESLGSLSVTLRDAEDEPLFEPPPGTLPMWQRVRIDALFAEDADADALRESLSAWLGQAPDGWRAERLEDRAWERSWMDQFQPMRFGERLWIVPSWHDPPDPGAVNLLLDPGLAFGTGTHPTTALCLEWLDRHPPAGAEVLDYGCGSGVLALAALKLGARRLTGVDIDEQALEASRDNIERNGLDVDHLALCLPDDLPPTARFDLVMANILAGPLVELSSRLVSHLRPGGDIILSGILQDQLQDVREAYAPWIEFMAVEQRDEWVCLHGRAPDRP